MKELYASMSNGVPQLCRTVSMFRFFALSNYLDCLLNSNSHASYIVPVCYATYNELRQHMLRQQHHSATHLEDNYDDYE